MRLPPLSGRPELKISINIAAIMLGFAQPVIAAPLTLDTPWIRETPPASKVGAGYVAIVNGGSAGDRLLSAATPVAARVEIHSMMIDQGVMRMRPVEGGLAVPAKGVVVLKPGSYHLMLLGLKRPLKRGDSVPMTLRFARGGSVSARFRVEAVDYKPAEASHAHH